MTAPPAEDHPISFLLDPATSPATVIDLDGQDIWRPVVNTTSRTIVYWSGTLVPDATGTGWELGTGRLVLDGWIDPSLAIDVTLFGFLRLTVGGVRWHACA